MLTQDQTLLSNYVVPLARSMVDGVRRGAQALTPFVGSDLELAIDIDRVNKYLLDAYQRGVQSRNKGKRVKAAAATAAEAQVGSQARTQARNEAASALNDVLHGFLTTNKT